MKTIILCGGKGLRMQCGTKEVPKAMSLVNGKPLIYHIMQQYAKYGFNEFILPLGYKGEIIKKYFIDFEWSYSDFTKETYKNILTYHNKGEDFKVTLVDTGQETLTGSRIKIVSDYIDTDTFMVTYGDGLADININKLIKFHKEKGTIATVTGVKKKSQYGILKAENGMVKSFKEKTSEEGIINGGFFVFKREFLNYLTIKPEIMLEEEPINNLIKNQQLSLYLHDGVWISIDTQKDLLYANEAWANGNV